MLETSSSTSRAPGQELITSLYHSQRRCSALGRLRRHDGRPSRLSTPYNTKSRFPAGQSSPDYAPFISALMTVSMAICDDTYSNKS